MAFESLTDRLAGVFKKLRGHGKLTEADIKAAMREVRMALLEADVNYKVAKDFCAKVSERAMGQEVMERGPAPKTRRPEVCSSSEDASGLFSNRRRADSGRCR